MFKLIPCAFFALPLLLLCLAAVGCDRAEPDLALDIGIVATINGRPVTLQQLQAKHDFNHLSWSASAMPSAEDLQRQYGAALTELIIAALVEDELETRNLEVGPDELQAAEAKVREDYPDGEFEHALEEDYIDLDVWRAFLHHRLSMLKFAELVLRPEISISSEEMEAYYQAHLADFTLPEREHFLVVDCDSRETAEKLRKAYVQSQSQPLRDEAEDVNVREITASPDRLPDAWNEALQGLKGQEASSIKSLEGRYHFLIFLERLPEQVLDTAAVYGRVEAGLMESRQEEAFNAWLTDKLAGADIRVSQPLLETWQLERRAARTATEAYGRMGNVSAPAPDEDDLFPEEENFPAGD